MKSYSVALILPYYGKLPNYFPLWLKSAGSNENFTFMIFSDEDFSCYDIPKNVRVNYMTFDELKSHIAPHLDFEFVLSTPYKLCDYKPLYGLIFHDWLKGYDFWGHVDPDIIWGNMNRFITDDMLTKYDRLYRNGHLVIYRNNDVVNEFVLNELPGRNISYRDVYKTVNYVGLDESDFTADLFAEITDGGGGTMSLTSQTLTRLRDSSYSLMKRCAGSLLLLSDGVTVNFRHLLLMATMRQKRLCMCIYRRGP